MSRLGNQSHLACQRQTTWFQGFTEKTFHKQENGTEAATLGMRLAKKRKNIRMGIQHDIINQTGEVNNSNNKRTTKTTKTRTTTKTQTTNNNNNTHNNTHNYNHNHKNKENNNKNKAAWERMGHSHHFGLVCHLQPHVFLIPWKSNRCWLKIYCIEILQDACDFLTPFTVINHQ